MGLAARRALALALDAQVAGVSTLDALAAGAPDALPVIDARRREVFTLLDGKPVAAPPEELEQSAPGRGLRRRRRRSLPRGARGGRRRSPARRRASCTSPARASTRRSRRDFGPAELVEPIYVRAPDADRMR